MSERYTKLYATEANLYAEGSPIVVRAGALQKDNENGKIFAQLKFQNFSDKIICYVKVLITPFDATGNSLDEAIPFEYLDLDVADRTPFGTKQPLHLTNRSTRSFRVSVCTVAFNDGSAWSCDSTDWTFISADSEMATKIATEDTYQQALALIKDKKYDDALSLLESITEHMDVTVDIATCKDAIAKIQKKSRRKRRNAILIPSIILLLGALSYFVGYPLVSVKNGNYKVYIDMYKIKEFTVPNNVTSIKDEAFIRCESLTSVTIPDSVTSIGELAFYNCDSLTSVTIGKGVTSIGFRAFDNCDSLTSVIIPDNVTYIGNDAFNDCDSLTSVTIGDSVTSIGGWAFFGCPKLTTVTIGNSVTTIKDQAFDRCDSLTSITIPASVTSIDDWAFYNCSSLTDVYFEGTMQQWKSYNVLLPYKTLVHCSDGIYTNK